MSDNFITVDLYGPSEPICNFDFICCICLDEDTVDLIKLECCQQLLHKSCFVSWIISKGIDFYCPICRNKIHNLTKLITLNDIFDNITNNFPRNNKLKIDNANEIIHQYWYINNGNNTINITLEQNSNSENNNIHPLRPFNLNCFINKFIASMIIIMLLAYFVFSISQGLNGTKSKN